MLLQVEVHTARRHQTRSWGRGTERQRERCHRYGMRIVRVDDLRCELAEDARELPRRRQVDLVARRECHQIGSFARTSMELALAVSDEHGAVSNGSKAKDGQEDLVLSAAPGPGGVDVEREHSSQSFANLRPT